MAVLILMAWISLKTESSLWFLIKLKLEFLIQVSPVFILGVFWRRLTAGPALAGMVAGTVLTLLVWSGAAMGFWDSRSPWGISAGVWGLGINYAVCVIGALLSPSQRSAPVIAPIARPFPAAE